MGVRARCRCPVRSGQRSTFRAEEVGDETASGGDYGLTPRQRGRLWEFIRALAAEGTAVLFSTHNVAEAERNAGRVIVLADGELIYQGSARDLETEVGGQTDFETAFVEFLRRKGH